MLENQHESWESRFGTCLFDRDKEENNESIEMTVEDVCKALGKNVKIVKGN